jgi:hypothetical protein
MKIYLHNAKSIFRGGVFLSELSHELSMVFAGEFRGRDILLSNLQKLQII